MSTRRRERGRRAGLFALSITLSILGPLSGSTAIAAPSPASGPSTRPELLSLEDRIQAWTRRTPGSATRLYAKRAISRLDALSWMISSSDILMLCSDGLNTMLSDEEIIQLIMANNGDVDAACEALVEEANAKGGEDNVTVVLIRVDEDSKSST